MGPSPEPPGVPVTVSSSSSPVEALAGAFLETQLSHLGEEVAWALVLLSTCCFLPAGRSWAVQHLAESTLWGLCQTGELLSPASGMLPESGGDGIPAWRPVTGIGLCSSVRSDRCCQDHPGVTRGVPCPRGKCSLAQVGMAHAPGVLLTLAQVKGQTQLTTK